VLNVLSSSHRGKHGVRRSQVGGGLVTVLAVVLTTGCADGERRAGDTGATAAVPPGQQPPAPSAGGAPTPQMIALGDSIFRGQAAGGLCHTCHGQDAKGTQLGPNLTDAEWLNSDGSYQGIVNTIMSGVATPKKFPGVMLPRGGSPLTDDQVRAVAAYVDSKTP
jgi:mono/diheme cytochrome c family protein